VEPAIISAIIIALVSKYSQSDLPRHTESTDGCFCHPWTTPEVVNHGNPKSTCRFAREQHEYEPSRPLGRYGPCLTGEGAQ
jgi:hypothetical protein